MDTTRAEQIALDDALVAPANRLKIGKSNLRLSSDLNFKEATLQVVYDVLKLTPFYKAFQIIADVPEIYMQEFWATETVHHHSICFKMNNKKHIVNLEYFREMLQICPKLHNQQFEELPFKEAILTFLRDLGHSGEIKMITYVNVNKLHQPWRSFAANVYYAYLLWEDFVYQVENKNVKRSNKMYYPRFTKVIVNFFMTKDQSIPRRNKLYGAMLPDELTNEAIKDSESYKEYYAIASGAEPLKTKATVKKKQVGSDMLKTPSTKGKILKTSAKAAKTSKKKQPAKTSKAKGLTVLSEVALTEAEQMKLATKRILIQTYTSYASGSGADEGTEEDDDEVVVNDDDEDNDDDNDDADNQDDDGQEYDEHDDDEQSDDDEQTNSDNDGDDFVHPKFSTHDEEDKEEDSFDPRVQTPSHVESTDDEEIQDANVEGDKMNEEETNEEAEVDALYRDVNVNLEGRDTEMTDAPRTIVQTTQVIEDTHVIITPVYPEGQQHSSSVSSGFVSNMLNPSPDTGIDSLFNLNTESTSLVDVSVTTFAEPPLLSATTLPPPPTPLITHLQQTPVPTPLTVLSSSLQDLPNFGSLFGFEHRLKTLENNFLEFNQTNQFAAAVSSILGIVDAYLANKMHEAVKTAIQLQSERLRDEAQAKNADFLNKLDDNIKKIIKDQVKEQVKAKVSKILPKIEKTVNEQLEADVLTRSSNESNTSHAIAANLSKLELNKILIDKMESNKDDEDKDEEPFAGSNRGSKRRRAGKEPESTSAPKEKTSKTTIKSTEGSKSHHKSAGESAQAEKPMHTAKDLEEPAHQEFEIRVTEDQPNEETSQLPDCSLAQIEDPRESFNELMDTPLNFSAFMMNRLKVDTLTPELLTGSTFGLMKGSCKSLVELEYFLEEVYKATTDQLNWINPEGQQYPHDLESARDVYSKHKIIAVTKLEIVEWHNYKHLDWITVSRDDDKQVEKSHCVESYQKKLNLTKPDTYRSDLKRREAYSAYSNPRGFIYQNKDKKNRLMRIDELHKFSDDKAAAMIQAIDKQLKTRRIMRSLEKFMGGRPYEDKIDSMHSTLSMYYDYDTHVKGELLVMMKNSQSVNLLIFISNTLIELFNDFGFDCDGIPERPTMYLNLWSHKVVRNRYSNPMIQPEPEGSTQGYPLDSVEVLRYDTKGEKNIRVISFTMKMEILLEPTSNKLMVEHAEFDESDTHVLERFDTSAGNPVKEILLKLNLPDHRILKDGGEVKEFQRSFRHSDTERLSRSDEVLKLKNFKKDATLKLFKSTNQERYEHVGPEVTRSHGGKIYKMAKRDYAWLMISRCSRSHSRQAKEQAQDLKSMITTSNHKIND
ncbi:hypothetical protein Tco_0840308 [Tanacetum coccineum]|uniref:Uncharacterized protein n=1 Tax=Tanacetum coccineum TaxID=301880 RepID=A0ABQ5AUC4_9ASTR